MYFKYKNHQTNLLMKLIELSFVISIIIAIACPTESLKRRHRKRGLSYEDREVIKSFYIQLDSKKADARDKCIETHLIGEIDSISLK